MMLETEGVYEHRSLTNGELAAIVTTMREARGWTQETFAELARIAVRTVQRVERGEPSNVDTRRALAQALEWQDIDVFNQPWPFPNVERIQAEQERIERETVAVAVQVIKTGRELREFADIGTAWQFSQLGELAPELAETYAHLEEYFQDYGDVKDCYSPSQKLGVNQDFQELIDVLKGKEISICAGTRRVRIGVMEGSEGVAATIIYVLAGPTAALPSTLRVPRKQPMAL